MVVCLLQDLESARRPLRLDWRGHGWWPTLDVVQCVVVLQICYLELGLCQPICTCRPPKCDLDDLRLALAPLHTRGIPTLVPVDDPEIGKLLESDCVLVVLLQVCACIRCMMWEPVLDVQGHLVRIQWTS